MKNEYEIRGDMTAIIINSPKYGRFETIISTNKLERARNGIGSWCVKYSNKTKSFYVYGRTSMVVNGKQKTIILHRLITNAPKGMDVDHRNHDTLDNTNDNLRICTQAENKQNKKCAQSNNKSSGIRGVTWDKNSGKWKSQVRINGKNVHLGLFDELEDAEKSTKYARAKYMPFSSEAS